MKNRYLEEFMKDVDVPSNDSTIFDILDEYKDPVRDQLLTTKEAANFLRLTETALRIMVHRGKIPTYRLGRRLRFKLRDCQALINGFLEFA